MDVMRSTETLSSENIQWLCCECSHGVMFWEIDLGCVDCGHRRCSNCYVGEEDSLYPKPKKIKEGMEYEALHGDRHGSEIDRAAMFPTGNTIEVTSTQLFPSEGALESDPGLAALTCSNQDKAVPIGGLDQVYEGERTPRSNKGAEEDTFDLTAFDGDRNHDFDTLFPDREGYSTAFNWAQVETNVIGTCGPSDEGSRSKTDAPETFNPDRIDLPHRLDLDPNDNPADFSIEPQIPSPIFPSDINAINPAHFHNAFPFAAPWTGPVIHSSQQHISSFPYNQWLDLPAQGFSSAGPQFSDMDSLIDQREELPRPRSPVRRNSDECLSNINKRKFYQEDPEDRPAHKTFRACESCSSTTSIDENRPLACLFYKRDPARHASCIKKKFKNISALRQHLDNDHRLGVYHCKSCWDSFADQESLDAHASCEPTNGSSVDQLPPIPKARCPDPNAKFNYKWYWSWKKLFGEKTALPDCPYSHPTRDMAGHLFSQFLQGLTTQGTKLDVRGFEEAMSQWLASYPEPTNEYPVMDVSNISSTV